MKLLFVADEAHPERWTRLLQAALPMAEIRVWHPDSPAFGADYAIVWRPPGRLFERETRLRAVFNLGAGVDGLLGIEAMPPGLPLIRLEDAGMSAQMAEYVVHQVVESSRDMVAYRAQQVEGVWRVLRPIRRDAWPVGVLGLGRIGARVARTLATLEYPVAGWARRARTLDGVEVFAGDAGLGAFLKRTRVLVNTLPLTDVTRDLLDYRTLTALLPDAVVINVGRGEQLVDADLIRAMNEGHVRAATLDVFREEPLPPEHPFWRQPGLTITPHVSARTLREATVAQIADKIRALEAGLPVSGVVDRSRGY